MMEYLDPLFLICKMGITVYTHRIMRRLNEKKHKALNWCQEGLNKSAILAENVINEVIYKVLRSTLLLTIKSLSCPIPSSR